MQDMSVSMTNGNEIYCSKIEKIKYTAACFPNRSAAVLLLALIYIADYQYYQTSSTTPISITIKSVHLGDLSTFMVSTKQGDFVWVSKKFQ